MLENLNDENLFITIGPMTINKDEIRVIPTQAIIQDLIANAANEALPKNYKDALFGPINLSQTDLKNIKLNSHLKKCKR